MTTPRQVLDMEISERDFQKQVIALAKLHNWTVAHFRPARRENGTWVTPVQADGAGFPDLVLVRERVIYAEIKAEAGKLSEAQEKWQYTLEAAGAEYYIWRPSDWEEIENWLR